MKIYVTKYLFTEGIQEWEAEDRDMHGCATVWGSGPGYFNGAITFHGNEWHRTREAAVAHAEVMRTKKLASIDKQRKKIADMVIG